MQYETDIFLSHSSGEPFYGACCDTGASKSVIGKQQAHAYFVETKTKFKLSRKLKNRFFTFGKQRVSSLGQLEL